MNRRGSEPPPAAVDERFSGERLALVALGDLAVLAVAFLLSTLLRFEFSIPPYYLSLVVPFLGVVLPVQVAVLYAFGVYRLLHRYSGLADLVRIAGAVAVGTAVAGALGVVLAAADLYPSRIPFSILGIDLFVGTAFVGGGRIYYRMAVARRKTGVGPVRRTLVVGAGDGGSLVAKHLRASPNHEVVGFVDDALTKQGRVLDGIPIRGTLADLPRLIDALHLDEVIFGIPSAPGALVRRVFHACRERVAFRTVPGLMEVLSGREPTALREVQVEDLLRREPVRLDDLEVRRFLAGRTVLISGGGGSIGSELCRQAAALAPRSLIVLDRYENNVYEIHRELGARHPGLRVVPVVGDIADRPLLDRTFAAERPRVVFHAAAHKHVPLMEENPIEAVRNNVFGTLSLIECAERNEVDKFVLISTDKAVRPVSVMGTTKRLAEMIAQSREGRSRTHFVTVRFGNVLNSAGSVVPLFTRQIHEGGPVTVTDPEMRRYFMTIPEASQLVIQAGAQGAGGEVFVLDMGEPVRILDLARDLILLSGLRPDHDIRIEFIGPRPGEKLSEELLQSEEGERPTGHPKIRVARCRRLDPKELESGLERLAETAANGDAPALLEVLGDLVPDFALRAGGWHRS